MSDDDRSDTNDVSLEHETQFVEQSGDEDVLWEVQEITAERGNKYKVKWAGIDPDTGKPWPESWVVKHDCTDDLVVDWKAKKKLAAGQKRGKSRKSGASQRAESSTSGAKTRPSSTPRPTSSRLDPDERRTSLPPKPNTAKRKRQSETPRPTSSGAVQADEQTESARPRKKQKTIIEVLLPPISSDEEEEGGLLLPPARAKDALANEGFKKSDGAPLDVSDGEDSLPPRATGGSEHRSDVRSKSSATSSKATDVGAPRSKVETKVAARRKEQATKTDVLPVTSEDEDEQLRPPRKFSKPEQPESTMGQREDLPEKKAASIAPPVKIGPPRGVKRQEKARKSGLSGKPGPSRAKPPKDDVTNEHVAEKESGCEPLLFGGPPLLLQQSPADGHPSPPRHIVIPPTPPPVRPRSPVLSPGAKARLELFDRLMANLSQPDAAPASTDVSEHVPDGPQFNPNDVHDATDSFDPPPPVNPPPPMSEPKPSSSNGLIVPETESSGNSQGQSQPLPKPTSPPPQPPRKPADLPTIAVIAPSAASSSASPQDLVPPQRPPSSTNRPPKKLPFKIGSNATTNARSRVADPEPPPSSIESFTSPQRVDKRKQRTVEDDQLRSSSLSEEDDAGESQKKHAQRNVTDSELKKRGKELFDQAQLARETGWQKNKKPKRLKTINEIVNGRTSSSSKGTPLTATSGAQGTVEMLSEDVVDLTGGANSTTLDTPERSEAQPVSEEMRERLRIELRQEEEENTQEAMGVHLPPPVEKPKAVDCGDPQMPPPENPFPSEDIVHVEQPSTDLLQASVIVQASQEQQHEDTEIDPSPANQPDSSLPRPVPESLTDSSKRRLGEALSLLNVKSEEIQRVEIELADERKNIQGLKTELAELRQSAEPTGPVRAAWDAERAQWTQERNKWERDFSTWETQHKEMSEEKANLLARVAELSDAAIRTEETKAKLSELESERAAWINERDVIRNDILQRSEELAVLTKIRGEYDQHRSKWEAEKTLWADEKTGWETERTTLQEKQETLSRLVDELTASIESLKAAKTSVEKDRDFFHEQYSQASVFVGSVRDENVELEKRAKIAEGQAREGVATIKALFEGRVKALQADVDRWRGLAELLQEKDRRTNDEIRAHAARAPELGELCARLSAENESLETEVRKLDRAQQRSVHQRNKLFYDILLLKKERASLRFKLSKRSKVHSRTSTQETSKSAPPPSVPEDPEGIDPNDMRMPPDSTSQSLEPTFDEASLFPCMWRPEWRDQCQHVFDTKEDLERHMQGHFRDLSTQ